MTQSWIEPGGNGLTGTLRLFCLPFAGSGASAFRLWHGGTLQDVELCPIQLPGRERRLADPPYTQLEPLVDRLADVLPLDKPFALFGHSLGALIAFELARELRRRGGPMPVHLFVSGAPAPHLQEARPPRSLLDRDDLIDELRRLGGTPEEILACGELVDVFMPSVRADFAIIDTYRHGAEPPLPIPVTAFGGDADPDVSVEELRAWRELCAASFTPYILPGDHFFVFPQADRVRRLIRDALEAAIPRSKIG